MLRTPPATESVNSPSTEEEDKDVTLTPTQELFLEVLVARVRLGEGIWTFSTRETKIARQLETLGYVGWKSGIVEKTILVWLTEKGRKELLSHPYEAPLLKSYVPIAKFNEAELRVLELEQDVRYLHKELARYEEAETVKTVKEVKGTAIPKLLVETAKKAKKKVEKKIKAKKKAKKNKK